MTSFQTIEGVYWNNEAIESAVGIAIKRPPPMLGTPINTDSGLH